MSFFLLPVFFLPSYGILKGFLFGFTILFSFLSSFLWPSVPFLPSSRILLHFFLPTLSLLLFPKQSLLAVYLHWNSNSLVSSASGSPSLPSSAFTEFQSIDEEAPQPISPHLPDSTSSFNVLQLTTYPVEKSRGWWSRVPVLDIPCFLLSFFFCPEHNVGQ